MQHNILDVHPTAVISAFHQNVRNRKMCEELVMNKVKDVAELYVLADRCARAEEGRKYPGEDAGAGTDSIDEDCRISGSDRPLRFEYWGVRGAFISYLPAPLHLASI